MLFQSGLCIAAFTIFVTHACPAAIDAGGCSLLRWLGTIHDHGRQRSGRRVSEVVRGWLDVRQLAVGVHRLEPRQRVPDVGRVRGLPLGRAEHLSVRAVRLAALRHVVPPAHVRLVEQVGEVRPIVRGVIGGMGSIALAADVRRSHQVGVTSDRDVLHRGSSPTIPRPCPGAPAGSTTGRPRTCGPGARTAAHRSSSSGSRGRRAIRRRRDARVEPSNPVHSGAAALSLQ